MNVWRYPGLGGASELRCKIHDLAAGPDGRCALCRTSDRAERRREGARLGVQLIAGSALMMIALLGYAAFRRAERTRSETPVVAPEARVGSAPAVAKANPPASSVEPEATPSVAPEPPPTADKAETSAPSASAALSAVATVSAPRPAESAPRPATSVRVATG